MGEGRQATIPFRRWVTAALLALAAVALPPGAMAQGGGASPLEVSIFFPSGTGPFGPTDPIPITVQVRNAGSSDIYTTEGFLSTEFWRRLFFTDPLSGIVTNTAEGEVHRATQVSYCFSRRRVLLRPTALPVVPVEVVAASSVLEYRIADVRSFYSITRPGHWKVNARVPVQTFDFGNSAVVLTDCDQFEGQTVVNVGEGVAFGRTSTTLTSNTLEFDVLGDSTPPTTTVDQTPLPNAAGWNWQDVTLNFAATDDAGGSGVARIVVTTSGAQAGQQVLGPGGGPLTIATEGITTVTFHAEDNAGNVEPGQSLVVRLDKTAPDVSLFPPSGTFQLNQAITVTFGATDPGPAGGAASSGLDTLRGTVMFPGGTPTQIASPATITLTQPGTTVVSVTAQDTAGSQTSRSAEYAVVAYTFVGFAPPINASSPPNVLTCPSSPAKTFKFGDTVPVKFQLFDSINSIVSTAVVTIRVAFISGTPPSQTPTDLGTGASDTGNQFRFDSKNNQYVFNLNTRVLSRGVWRIDAMPDDGSIHSVCLGFK